MKKKIEYLKTIDSAVSVESSCQLEKTLPKSQVFTLALRNKNESLLIKKLNKIKTIEAFNDFYEEASCYEGFDFMKNLRLAIAQKEDELFS